MAMDDKYRLVYSNVPQRQKSARPPGTGRATMCLERKGRAGKAVTVISGLALSLEELRVFLKELQQLCGTGGTVKDNHLELQGDCRERVKPRLKARGYQIS
jgi:translation initiation factor 1